MVDYTKCRLQAQKVLTQCGIREPYVDVFDIAESNGFEIVYFKPKDEKQKLIAGFSKSKKIYLNIEDHPTRRTFTIAHELAHYFLKHKPDQYGVYYRNSLYKKDKPDLEKEADCFAAELLMPKKFIIQVKKRYDLTDNDVDILAKLFGVSNLAMSFRLKNISSWYSN